MLPNSDEVDCFGSLISVVDSKPKNAGVPPVGLVCQMFMELAFMALANRG